MSISNTNNQCKACGGAGKEPIMIEDQMAGYSEEDCKACNGKGYIIK